MELLEESLFKLNKQKKYVFYFLKILGPTKTLSKLIFLLSPYKLCDL